MTELAVVFVLALLIFGPKKLPEIARGLGKAMRMFREASQEIQRTLEEDIRADENRKLLRELKQDVSTTMNQVQSDLEDMDFDESDDSDESYEHSEEPDESSETQQPAESDQITSSEESAIPAPDPSSEQPKELAG